MRNKPGGLALVEPASSHPGVQACAGKVVTTIEYRESTTTPGKHGWLTEPLFTWGPNHCILWDDMDLVPLGDPGLRESEVRGTPAPVTQAA